MARRKWILSVLLVAAALVAMASAFGPDLVARFAYAQESGRAAAAADSLARAADLSTAFTQVAKAIGPSLVSISSVKEVKTGPHAIPDPFFSSPFRDFFGDDLFRRFFAPRSPNEKFVQRGLGSGVIVSEDGYILTNHHVVREADEVTVSLSDGRDLKAEIVGTDPKSDLALIRVKAKDLHPAKLGDSDALEIGEWVVAAGNPFGLSHTITAGIVSAKGRSNVGIADYEDFIQTDCAINPGNSGGPLLNLRGEVVGINTAIFTRSGGYMGIGFAIPINMAKEIMKSLKQEGEVVRGWLGVIIQDLDEGLANSFGFEGTDGVLVSDVSPGGPAEKAGIRRGDILVEFDGKKVDSMHRLRTVVAATKPGRKVEVEVFRNGETKTLTVKIGRLPSEGEARGEAESETDLGLTVRDLTPELARELGIEAEGGVVVTAVEPLGLGARAGIRVKDVILSLMGQEVKNARQFRRLLGRQDLSKGIRMLVQTGDVRRFVFLKKTD